MQRTLRRALETILARGGALHVLCGLVCSHALALVHRNVVPDDGDARGEPSLQLARRRFALALLGDRTGQRYALAEPGIGIDPTAPRWARGGWKHHDTAVQGWARQGRRSIREVGRA